MTTPDYRALIAELLNGLVEQQNPKHPWPGYTQCAMERARAILAAPEAVGVADEEILRFADSHELTTGVLRGGPTPDHTQWIYHEDTWGTGDYFPVDATADVLKLSRYGTAHPAPVPVGERLPGVGDCDAEGKCWWLYPETDDDFAFWQYENDGHERWQQPTHWLPHWALPLPGAAP